MSIKELTNLAHDLWHITEETGDIEEASTGELQELLEYAGKIVTILEGDKDLSELVLSGSSYGILEDLKTLAVVCSKAIPLKDKLDDILGSVDFWHLSDVTLELSEIMGGLDEKD